MSEVNKYVEGLTVIVLTYNSESTIVECMDSLVNQQNKNFDLLIVDDNSDDNTIKLIKNYNDKLKINVIKSGAHSIAKGRNIGLHNAKTEYIAFLDSDDAALPDWTSEILEAFINNETLGIISGKLLPKYDNKVSEAIATNDIAIRELFSSGRYPFYGNNCALNRRLVSNYFYNEKFKYSEDLEISSRIEKYYKWECVPTMLIWFRSKNSWAAYSKQMYQYAKWKLFYEYKTKKYAFVDFVPLSIIILSLIISIILIDFWILLSIIVFSLAEAIFVDIYRRPTLSASLLTFPAWLVKNISWSLGILNAFYTLIFNKRFRTNISG